MLGVWIWGSQFFHIAPLMFGSLKGQRKTSSFVVLSNLDVHTSGTVDCDFDSQKPHQSNYWLNDCFIDWASAPWSHCCTRSFLSEMLGRLPTRVYPLLWVAMLSSLTKSTIICFACPLISTPTLTPHYITTYSPLPNTTIFSPFTDGGAGFEATSYQ